MNFAQQQIVPLMNETILYYIYTGQPNPTLLVLRKIQWMKREMFGWKFAHTFIDFAVEDWTIGTAGNGEHTGFYKEKKGKWRHKSRFTLRRPLSHFYGLNRRRFFSEDWIILWFCDVMNSIFYINKLKLNGYIILELLYKNN